MKSADSVQSLSLERDVAVFFFFSFLLLYWQPVQKPYDIPDVNTYS